MPSNEPKGKILVIDDDDYIRSMISLLLEKERYHPIEAENGEEAIKILREGDNMINVGLILTDIRMPKMDGLQYIDFLIEQAPGIPVVVITGYPDKQMEINLKAKGVKKYMVKPIEKQRLLETVREMVALGKDFEY